MLKIVTLLLGHRGQTNLPAWTRFVPVLFVTSLALQRRSLGWYDKRTLRLFALCWLRQRSMSTLLAYALFRRDLGMPLARAHAHLLAEKLARLSLAQQRMSILLLTEESMPVPPTQLTLNALQAAIIKGQTQWRSEFAQWLSQYHPEKICVVGNSGRLVAQGLGQAIDKHQIVVRFNQFRSHSADIGERIDIWVTAPNCSEPVPADVAWVVITGTIAFKLRDWSRFEQALKQGCRVLTVPLPYWRHLVKELDAPPSAGLLFLAWLHDLLGSWQRINALGFGYSRAHNAPYHHASQNYLPVTRHHWAGELLILQRWQQEGLQLELLD